MKHGNRDRNRRVSEVFDEVRKLQRDGVTVDREAICRKHPDLSGELQTRFKTLDALNAIARGHHNGGSGHGGEMAEEDLCYLQSALPAYRFVRHVDYGGQGRVYLARHKSTDKHVAIKLLLDGPLATDLQKLRFEREIELASRLRHPHIVEVFEHGVVRGRAYFAMEFVDGLPIDDYVCANDLTVTDILRLMATVCRAVDHAHHHGILHRDLKPDNVLVDIRGTPHLMDFGLAKDFQTPRSGRSLTMAGQVFGTLPYVSPEELLVDGDVKLDARADIYALGILLFELLTGVAPYSVEGHRAGVRDRILFQEPLTLARAVTTSGQSRIQESEADARFEAVIRKTLHKDRSRRYASAATLADDIVALANGGAITAEVDHSFDQLNRVMRRYRAQLAISVTAAIMAVVVTCLWWQADRSHARASRLLQFSLSTVTDVVSYVESSAALTGSASGDQLLDQLAGDLSTLQSQISMAGFDGLVPGSLRERQGDLARRRGRFAEATEHYGAVIDAESRRVLEADSSVLGRVHRKLAGVIAEGGPHYDAALGHLARVVPRDELETGRTHLAYADYLLNTGHVVVAHHQAFAALDVFAEVAPVGVADPAWTGMHAAALGAVGRCELRMGNPDAAMAALHEQVRLRQAVVDAANQPTYQHALMIAWRNLADAHRDNDEVNVAIDLLEQAVVIATDLLEQEDRSASWLRNIYGIFDRLGRLQLENGRVVQAHRASQQASAVVDLLAQADPISTEWRRLQGFAHILAGRVALAQRDRTLALESFASAIAIRKSLRSQNASPAVGAELATAHEYAGRCCNEMKQLQHAQDHLKAALGIRETLALEHPREVKYALDAIRAQYSLALWHARRRTAADTQSAVELVGSASGSLSELSEAGRLLAEGRRAGRLRESLKELSVYLGLTQD
jgi:serine/threonine protein kinase